jgi:tRNA modification GTPase
MLRGDTMAALATPAGAGAVAMVRVSGPGALGVAGRIFRGRCPVGDLPSGRAAHGTVWRGDVLVDEVLLTVFRSPRSYTGEDVVEISGHGGVVVARAVLQSVLEAGARPAEPGEFTQRAFLNGKMDLTQAEAVMDLISARGEASARAAAGQLEGRLGRVVGGLREDALTALAHLEAFIDFPEEGIDAEGGRQLLGRVEALREAVGRLLATSDDGRMLREGVRLVIHGRPNAGKSSLLNLLVGYDRAMVSEIPGTTRDTIEENLTLRGIPFRIVDTAGLRQSEDPLELEGMRRTQRHVESADVTIRVLEAGAWTDPGAASPREVRVLNKIDLWAGGAVPAGVVPMCCLDGRGLDELVAAVVGKTDLGRMDRLGEAVAINARHQHNLTEAGEALSAARESLERGDAPELTALELRTAVEAIGGITGGVDTEEVLGKIFSTFCIGK